MNSLTLREAQSKFAAMVARLILKAQGLGYEVTLGEAWRSEFEAMRLAKLKLGIKRSLHCDRLAIDINLFREGVWLTTAAAHQALGEWWESIGGAWGGRFGDPGHYSLPWGGRK